MPECPVCETPVTIPADSVQGEVIACPDCSTELEVLSAEPPTLALAPELAEDWGE